MVVDVIAVRRDSSEDDEGLVSVSLGSWSSSASCGVDGVGDRGASLNICVPRPKRFGVGDAFICSWDRLGTCFVRVMQLTENGLAFDMVFFFSASALAFCFRANFFSSLAAYVSL